MEHLPEEIRNTTYEKMLVQHDEVKSMRLKHKRAIFSLMRQCENLHAGVFMPHYGFFVGEFAVFQTLTEKQRKRGGGATLRK